VYVNLIKKDDVYEISGDCGDRGGESNLNQVEGREQRTNFRRTVGRGGTIYSEG